MKFNGRSYVVVDRTNFLDLDEEFIIKMRFKPASPNGIIFLAGQPNEGSYVCVELQNQYLAFR